MSFIEQIQTLDAGNLTKASEILRQLPANAIECNNWKEQYPYVPEVSFYIAHNNREIFIRFDVAENCTMATVTTDNGKVCTDSCVEFFMSLDDTGYYNFEFNCIGKVRLGFRKDCNDRVHASPEIVQTILRKSSLGTENFNERTGNNQWTLTVAIPSKALFKHAIENLSGLKAKANCYKCGDHLSHPHFLSWQPIHSPEPNFHLPQYFTDIEF